MEETQKHNRTRQDVIDSGALRWLVLAVVTLLCSLFSPVYFLRALVVAVARDSCCTLVVRVGMRWAAILTAGVYRAVRGRRVGACVRW